MRLHPLWFCFFVVSLVSCGGGGSGDSDSNADQADSAAQEDDTNTGGSIPSVPDLVQDIDSSLIGVWDWSEDYGDEGMDEIYLVVDEQGRLSEYDYFGDTFDGEDNCYVISRHWGKFTRSSPDYLYSETEIDSSVRVKLEVQNWNLYLTALEFNDDFPFPVGERLLFGVGMTNPPIVAEMDAMTCQ